MSERAGFVKRFFAWVRGLYAPTLKADMLGRLGTTSIWLRRVLWLATFWLLWTALDRYLQWYWLFDLIAAWVITTAIWRIYSSSHHS